MSASVSNIRAIRQQESINPAALLDIKIDEAQSQASATKVVQVPALISARFRTHVGEGFFPIDIETGIGHLEEALGVNTKGRIMFYLMRNVRFGNVAYVSPTAISGDLGIHITHVRRHLARLIADGHISYCKTENQGCAYMVLPAIGVKGGTQHEQTARQMWEAFGIKRMKDRKRKAKLKSSGGRS